MDGSGQERGLILVKDHDPSSTAPASTGFHRVLPVVQTFAWCLPVSRIARAGFVTTPVLLAGLTNEEVVTAHRATT
jgi:hypothetical protein